MKYDGTPAALPRCPVCGGTRWSARRRATSLRDCAGCTTVLNDRSSSRGEEESRYSDGRLPDEGSETAIAASRWEWVGRLLPPDADPRRISVLDIGCGQGAFLGEARRAGHRVAGVEISAAAVERCRRSGLEVLHGSLFDVGLPHGPWDIITFWDVLDQLEDPLEALRVAAGGLTSRGLIVVRGRNARIHAPLKTISLRMRKMTGGLPIPDPAIVHRWGIAPAGYATMMREAGLLDVRIDPGVPTPGDRHAGHGMRARVRAVAKTALFTGGTALHRISLGRLYPFLTVMATGRRGTAAREAP